MTERSMCRFLELSCPESQFGGCSSGSRAMMGYQRSWPRRQRRGHWFNVGLSEQWIGERP
jgi:hypothetical protein